MTFDELMALYARVTWNPVWSESYGTRWWISDDSQMAIREILQYTLDNAVADDFYGKPEHD